MDAIEASTSSFSANSPRLSPVCSSSHPSAICNTERLQSFESVHRCLPVIEASDLEICVVSSEILLYVRHNMSSVKYDFLYHFCDLILLVFNPFCNGKYNFKARLQYYTGLHFKPQTAPCFWPVDAFKETMGNVSSASLSSERIIWRKLLISPENNHPWASRFNNPHTSKMLDCGYWKNENTAKDLCEKDTNERANFYLA